MKRWLFLTKCPIFFTAHQRQNLPVLKSSVFLIRLFYKLALSNEAIHWTWAFSHGSTRS